MNERGKKVEAGLPVVNVAREPRCKPILPPLAAFWVILPERYIAAASIQRFAR